MNNAPQMPSAISRRLHPVFRFLIAVFAMIGVLSTVYLVSGLSADIAAFDETTGGYEYPYTGWTGTPIDYSTSYTTAQGLYTRGRIIDLHINCETGMINYNLLGVLQGEFREFSDRAKVVHQPQVECRERGFNTSVWDTIDDPEGLFPEFASSDPDA